MKITMIKNSLFFVLITVVSFTHAAQNRINYSIKITDAAHHLAEVTILFPQTESKTIDFIMPAWRLGKYKVLNLANGIRHFSVTDSHGRAIKTTKIDKNTWRARLEQSSKLAVTYQLYANQLAQRTRHIDDTHAYLDGVSTFMYSPEFINTPLSVELDVPKSWRSRSGMKKTGRNGFKADNYHILASSPIETGLHEYYTFSVDDRDYELVIWGKGNFDGKKIVDDYKKMVIEHGKLWGDYPFQNYLFIIHATTGASGATEHINSTVIQRDGLDFANKKDYHKFLSTSSHEFVHTWNVKAYRPEGIAQYNYTQENYSDLLWISEGSSSYFGELLLLRAGLFSPEDFLKELSKRVHTYMARPGREVMSAKQASFETWIEEEGDRANNSSVNIYSKGFLLSLLIDVELLKATEAKRGYAYLHQLLYERFPVPDKGFTAIDIQHLMQEISGLDYSDFWQKYIESMESINFDELFYAIGLEFVRPDNNMQLVWTGIEFNKTVDNNTITLLPTNSPAWRAGLAAGDVLIAINGIKVEQEKLHLLLKSFNKADEVKVTFFRRNILKEATMEIVQRPSVKASLEHVEDPSDFQKKMYKKWLGVNWPEDKAE